MGATWSRSRIDVTMDTRVTLTGVIPTITLRSDADTGKLRIGLWAGTTRVVGWLLPFLPAGIIFTMRDGRSTAVVNGELRDVPVFVKDWDGEHWPTRGTVLPHGPLQLTLDQEPGKVVPVLVDVTAEAVE